MITTSSYAIGDQERSAERYALTKPHTKTSFYLGLFITPLCAFAKNCSIASASACWSAPEATQPTKRPLPAPPKEAFSKRVSFESRYGTWLSFSLSASTTRSKALLVASSWGAPEHVGLSHSMLTREEAG